MCPPGAADFVARHLEYREVVGRRVLEVGSHDPDGVVRSIVGPLRPAQYIGADVVVGPGVDIVCPAEQVLEHFGPGSFDIVVTTEVLEHVRDWRLVVHNLKGVLRDGGMLLVTTRSVGFEFHGYPLDFWRYQPADISNIFGELIIDAIECDLVDPPGVFFRVRCVRPFAERDLTSYRLYSVVRRRRARSLTALDIAAARCLAAGKTITERLLPQLMRDAIRRGINRGWDRSGSRR
jgi:SAM-dependent methyltransferase